MNIKTYLKEQARHIYAVLKNPTYNGLAQTSHFGISATLVLSAARLSHWLWIPVAAILVAWAAWKEFRFDPQNERPEVSGGFWGDIEDFGFYLAGIGYAVTLIAYT